MAFKLLCISGQPQTSDPPASAFPMLRLRPTLSCLLTPVSLSYPAPVASLCLKISLRLKVSASLEVSLGLHNFSSSVFLRPWVSPQPWLPLCLSPLPAPASVASPPLESLKNRARHVIDSAVSMVAAAALLRDQFGAPGSSVIAP